MCDFKVGNEVVCVRMDAAPEMIGKTYIIRDVFIHPFGDVAVYLVGAYSGPCPLLGESGFIADRFRKVQRRDLSAWLKTSIGNTDKLDKRHRAPAKERA